MVVFGPYGSVRWLIKHDRSMYKTNFIRKENTSDRVNVRLDHLLLISSSHLKATD